MCVYQATVARHELFVSLEKSLCDENEQSLMRARLRGTKRRFALDLHQIWLTNLEHIREHRLGGLPQHANHGDGADRATAARQNTVSRRVLEENVSSDEEDLMLRPPADRGLPDRRDTESIVNISSQIVSVAAECTWASVPLPMSMGNIKKTDSSRSFKRKPTAELMPLPLPPPGCTRLLSNEEWSVAGKEGERLLLVTVERMAMSDEAEAVAMAHDSGGESTSSPTNGVDSLIRPPLWRVTAYDREDGSQGRMVLRESDARRTVAKEDTHALKTMSTADASSDPFMWTATIPTIYRQAIRCKTESGVKHSYLLEVSLTQRRPATPVIVLLRVLPLKVNQSNRVINSIVWIKAWFSCTQVKARLGLMGLPTADLEWWRDINNVTVKDWTRLASHLSIRSDDVNGDLRLRLDGSDEPLDDVLGVSAFDSDVCDDALKLLPLLRWESLSEEETLLHEAENNRLEFKALKHGEKSHCCPQGTAFSLTAKVDASSPERDSLIALEVEARARLGLGDVPPQASEGWEDTVEWDPTQMPLSMLSSGLSDRMDVVSVFLYSHHIHSLLLSLDTPLLLLAYFDCCLFSKVLTMLCV